MRCSSDCQCRLFPEPGLVVTEPELAMPPHRPLFQLPELKLPDFGQIFTQAFAPVLGPQPGDQGDAGLGLFGSQLNPFAMRQPPTLQPGPQQGFFASLFPALAATPPPQGHPDGETARQLHGGGGSTQTRVPAVTRR